MKKNKFLYSVFETNIQKYKYCTFKTHPINGKTN